MRVTWSGGGLLCSSGSVRKNVFPGAINPLRRLTV